MTTNGSTALITGGTSGIGRATARKLAELGVHVIVVGRNAERGKKTIDEIQAAGGKADFISSDFQDAASARAVAKRAIELGNGRVDILINNAGIYPFGPTHEMTEEQFDRVFFPQCEGTVFPGSGTGAADGQARQRGNREPVDNGCRLRRAGDESLRFEQGRHQFVDQDVGGGIPTERCACECSQSRTNAHRRYGRDGRGPRAVSRTRTCGAPGHSRRDCRGNCLSSNRSRKLHLRRKTCGRWRPHRDLNVPQAWLGCPRFPVCPGFQLSQQGGGCSA